MVKWAEIFTMAVVNTLVLLKFKKIKINNNLVNAPKKGNFWQFQKNTPSPLGVNTFGEFLLKEGIEDFSYFAFLAINRYDHCVLPYGPQSKVEVHIVDHLSDFQIDHKQYEASKIFAM